MKVAEVIDYIVGWLKSYCDDAGLNGFVVGVSGGVDSAVTSALCAKTSKDVLCLSMPIYQSKEQLLLARTHLEWLETHYERVKGMETDLTKAIQALEGIFPSHIQDGLTMANTRCRMRMVALYAFASHNRMLVAGTGNKVEDFGVGFFTKYGDGGADIMPIGDLLKSEVYEIGRELGIAEGILNASPVDGLWNDNRTDEAQIGATYSELEWAMGFEANPGDEESLGKREKEILSLYRKWHRVNQHKMIPIPICALPRSLKEQDEAWKD